MTSKIYELLKFELDAEYEPFEFQVIPVPPYEILYGQLSLEPYEYFGDIQVIFGLRVQKVIIYFNCDILTKVDIIFKGDVTRIIKQAIESVDEPVDTIMDLRVYFDANSQSTVCSYQKKSLRGKGALN